MTKKIKQTTEGHNYLNNETDFWTINKNRVFLKIITNQKNILEVGCGRGTFLAELGKRGIACEGIDFSKEMIEGAKKSCHDYPITLHYGDFTTYAFPKKYDFIILSAIIEHMEDDVAFMKKVATLLTENGEILLLTSAHPLLYSVFDKQAHHYRRYSKKQLHSLLEQTGFSIVSSKYWDILGIPFLFLARFLGKMPLNDKQLTNTYMNTIFDFWFQIFENRVPVPIGLDLIVVAKQTKTSFPHNRSPDK